MSDTLEDISQSNLVEFGYPNAATDLKLENNSDITLSKLNSINKNVGNNSSNGLLYPMNECYVYIFKGKPSGISSIYASFNKTGKLQLSKDTSSTTDSTSKAPDYTIKSIYEADIKVNEKVRYVPDKLDIEGSINYNTETVGSLLDSGLLGSAKNIAVGLSNINGIIKSLKDVDGKVTFGDNNSNETPAIDTKNSEFPVLINRYSNIPYYSSYNYTTLSSIKFDFAFGQSRLFSGLEEVVKPIVSMVDLFNLKKKDSKSDFYKPSYLKSKSEMLTNMYGSLFKPDDDNNNSNGSFLENLSEKFAGMVTTAAIANPIKGLIFVIGRNLIGPLMPSSLNWTFDFSKIDENGYPCNGSITLSGLKMVDMAPENFKSSWGLDKIGGN